MASQHEHHAGARHIPRRPSAAGCGCLSITCTVTGAKIHCPAQASYSLIHSQCFVHTCRLTPSTHTHSPRHASLLLFIHCAFAGAGSLATLLPPCVHNNKYCTSHSTFPSRQSTHLKFATATMPKKKGGKVQGRAKQKVKAQNASSAGGKPAWMKKFAKSFDDGRSLLPFHHIHMPIPHTLPRRPSHIFEAPFC
jgi:hypothetical protein